MDWEGLGGLLLDTYTRPCRSTADTYGRLVPDMTAAAATRMDEVFGKAEGVR